MPIKDPTIYPPYWKQFSAYIRFERAGNVCEQCGVTNGHFRYTSVEAGDTIIAPDDDLRLWEAEAWYLDTKHRVSKIVLTVAHLNHDGGVCDCKEQTGRLCARPDHVLALCQACHLALDLPKHIENRRKTLMTRNDARRPLFAEVANVPASGRRSDHTVEAG